MEPLPDDKHVELRSEIDRLRAEMREASDEARYADLCREIDRKLEELATLPATSPFGAAEQVRLAIECRDGGSTLGEVEETALYNAYAALRRMARSVAIAAFPLATTACISGL